MIVRRRFLTLTTAMVLACPLSASASTEQQRVVDRARIVVEEFLVDRNFANIRAYVQNAYAVFIVPDMLQAGLIIGAEHGLGVLLARDPQTGAWSDPAFYDIYGGSFGLQIGGKSSDVLFTIMNQQAIDKLLRSQFKLGADASVAAGRFGAGVGAGTTVQFGEDIYAFSRSKGLYGGLALDGSVVVPREDWNIAYYGAGATPESIITGNGPRVAAAAPLRESLAQF